MRLRRRRHPLWLQYSCSIYISSIYIPTRLYTICLLCLLRLICNLFMNFFYLRFVYGTSCVELPMCNDDFYIYIYIYSCTCCIFVFLAICFSFFLLFFRENRNCTGAFAGLVSLSIVRCRSLILRSLSPSLYRGGFVCGGGRR